MALQEVVATRWRKITGTEVVEGYGLTESSPVLTCNPAARAKPGSIGVPLPSTELKCVDDQGNEVATGEAGEIIARGPQIMPGASPAKPEMSCAMAGCSPATSGKWMPKAISTLWTDART